MPKPGKWGHLRAKAIGLRVEERLGTKEIGRRTGVPLSTLHYWLRPFPLTKEERSAIISASPRYVAPKKTLPGRPEDRMEFDGKANSRIYGRAGEYLVAHRLLMLGAIVMRPDIDGDKVDLYARLEGSDRVVFIQVRKTSSPPSRSGLPTVSLRRSSGGKSQRLGFADFHILVGWCPDNSRCYVFDADEVARHGNSVTVCEEAEEAWWKVEARLNPEADVSAKAA